MRGQTTLDFAIGIALFLGVLLFVFTFVPGILAPFDVGGEEEPALANRVANSATQDVLGSTTEPYVLDRQCTVEFFNDTVPGRCRFDSADLDEQFDLRQAQNMNISIEGNATSVVDGRRQLCWIDVGGPVPSDPGIVERSHPACGSDDIVLRKGEAVPETGTTITARRVVELHGRSVTLTVVVW